MTVHSERKHSKLSASGAERWFQCPGSVQLSEGLPDKDSKWSIEGTIAHEVLELLLRARIARSKATVLTPKQPVTAQMISLGIHAADFIYQLHLKIPHSEILVETKISLGFIHPDAFGTFDGAVIDHFGTLHVFDYKYGAGHAVSPKNNLQMIFYGLALAYKYDWNFKKIRLWIIQPRIKGYDGPLFWDLTIGELRSYVGLFTKAVNRVLRKPELFVEGSWCHWCKAKSVCPLKTGKKLEKAKSLFAAHPI